MYRGGFHMWKFPRCRLIFAFLEKLCLMLCLLHSLFSSLADKLATSWYFFMSASIGLNLKGRTRNILISSLLLSNFQKHNYELIFVDILFRLSLGGFVLKCYLLSTHKRIQESVLGHGHTMTHNVYFVFESK